MSTTSCTSVGTQGQPGTVLLLQGILECNSPQVIGTMMAHLVTVQNNMMEVDGGSINATIVTLMDNTFVVLWKEVMSE